MMVSVDQAGETPPKADVFVVITIIRFQPLHVMTLHGMVL